MRYVALILLLCILDTFRGHYLRPRGTNNTFEPITGQFYTRERKTMQNFAKTKISWETTIAKASPHDLELRAMVLGNHGRHSRGKGRPTLPTSVTTNVWRRFCVAIAASISDGIIYTARRKCQLWVLPTASSYSSTTVDGKAIQTRLDAGSEYMCGFAESILQLWTPFFWIHNAR